MTPDLLLSGHHPTSPHCYVLGGKAALGSGAGSLIPTDILSKAIVALVNLITADADVAVVGQFHA